MKRLVNGKYIVKGYSYKGYEIRCHGYYPPEKRVVWEGIDIETGNGDVRGFTKREIKILIDSFK